jgi:pimeloyl-ACP methyl ester carboxylesterase
MPTSVAMNKIYLALIALILAGCATPAQRFAAVAANHGFIASTVTGRPFEHWLYANRLTTLATADKVLHVYLDGDGTPWEHESWPSDDPTSRNPLILSLMAQDQTPSILLGRPCYHGLNTTTFCNDSLWTSKRYAQEIVDSMVSALNSWLQKQSVKKVVLIGYSGGGALAVLMADKIPAVQTVVTFAANLDVEAWSKAQGYPTLNESLNPITQKKLPSRIKQLHLAGAEDDIVPAEVVKSYADQQHAAYHVFPDFDHQCCWEEAWPTILQWF